MVEVTVMGGVLELVNERVLLLMVLLHEGTGVLGDRFGGFELGDRRILFVIVAVVDVVTDFLLLPIWCCCYRPLCEQCCMGLAVIHARRHWSCLDYSYPW